MNTGPDIREKLGLQPIINLTGTLTINGGMNVVPQAIEAASSMMARGVIVNDLQAKASRVIARICGSEAGFIAGCTSAGLCMAIAGSMSGDDMALIEQLPDTTGMKNEVVVQAGHLTNYGHPGEQDIRLCGGKTVPVGDVNSCRPYQLEAALTERTAAALYVVSHHCAQIGQIPFERFVALCHARAVPVIVDLAAEYDLTGYISAGADITVHSSQKFLGGPTAGIVAGGKALVRAAYFQNYGIGRPMKVGKEGVAGAIAALEAWEQRDHSAVRAMNLERLNAWQAALAPYAGISATLDPDPTGNPFERLRVAVDPEQAGLTAWELAARLENGNPPVLVRGHQLELGYFIMDPRAVREGEVAQVANLLRACLENAGESAGEPAAEGPQGAHAFRMARVKPQNRWPD